MSPIEKLKKQHRDILAALDQIASNLRASLAPGEAEMALGRIKSLSQLLEEHLIVEDDFLYKALKKHPQEGIRDLAYLFSIELGGIRHVFSEYEEKWASPDTIGQSYSEFVSETKALTGALKRRIRKEDTELFPLLER